jgi:hypothetical protein
MLIPSWPGLSRPSVEAVCRTGGRDKPGHDGTIEGLV